MPSHRDPQDATDGAPMTAGPSGDHVPAQGAEPSEPIASMGSFEPVEPVEAVESVGPEPVESVLVEGSGRKGRDQRIGLVFAGLAVAALLVGGLIALVLAMAG